MNNKRLVLVTIHRRFPCVEQLKEYSSAEVQAEDKRLNDIIKDMKYNLVEVVNEEENHPLVQQWRIRKDEYIRKWGDALAGKTKIGTRNKPLDSISAQISNEMRKELHFNEGEIRYVRKVLPDEYKRDYPDIGHMADLDETIRVGFKDIDEYKLEELREYVENAGKVEKVLKDRTKLAVDNLQSGMEHAVETAAKKYRTKLILPKQQKPDIISTKKALPNKCESYYAAVDVYNEIETKHKHFWLKLANKLEEYPATPAGEPITKEDKTVARYLRGKLETLIAESKMLASFVDDKYAFSLWHWFKVLVDEDNWGKHAAAVMNKIKPVGDTEKDRPLTRERVGDVKERYWEDMKKFSKGMKWAAWWQGLAEVWDEKFKVPRNADRRNREAPKLSETSIGADTKPTPTDVKMIPLDQEDLEE
jgi:hypothetical protein